MLKELLRKQAEKAGDMHRAKAEGTLSGERGCNRGLDTMEKAGRLAKG